MYEYLLVYGQLKTAGMPCTQDHGKKMRQLFLIVVHRRQNGATYGVGGAYPPRITADRPAK